MSANATKEQNCCFCVGLTVISGFITGKACLSMGDFLPPGLITKGSGFVYWIPSFFLIIIFEKLVSNCVTINKLNPIIDISSNI